LNMSRPKTFPDLAAICGRQKVKDLLAAGANVHEVDQNGRSALARICRLGQTEKMDILFVAGADPNAIDHEGEAPLQSAARHGHLKCVRALLANGADINHCPTPAQSPNYSESALCSAVRKCPEAAQLLLEAGSDPNLATGSKRYPLLFAISANNAELVRELLRYRASVGITDNNGRTPLHCAVKVGSLDIIQVLLELGANPNAKDGQNVTPVFLAVNGPKPLNIPMLRLLLTAKPDLSLQNSWKKVTALEQAVADKQSEIAELLRQAGSPPAREEKRDSNEISVAVEIDFADDITEEDLDDGSEPDDSEEESDEVITLPQVTEGDKALARSLPQEKSDLLGDLGWRMSSPPWEMLVGAQKPVPLGRMAYFARGRFNAPAGKELADGPTVLGERYASAADRFVAEGLLQRIQGVEEITLIFSEAELKSMARDKSLQSRGIKSKLAALLHQSLPPESFQARSDSIGGIFQLTEAGRNALERRKEHFLRIEEQQRKQIVEGLEEQDLATAVKIARGLNCLLARRPSRKDSLTPEQVATARTMLMLIIPQWLQFDAARQGRLRAILAAQRLCDEWNAEWSTWDKSFITPTTPKGKPVPLRQLLLYILEQGRSFHGWDWEQDLRGKRKWQVTFNQATRRLTVTKNRDEVPRDTHENNENLPRS
jgi:ankyrin repeat protein